MKLLKTKSLERGSTIIDFVFPADRTSYSVPDLIGIVAAYLGQGRYPTDMEKELAERLNPRLARQAKETFKYLIDMMAPGFGPKVPPMTTSLLPTRSWINSILT